MPSWRRSCPAGLLGIPAGAQAQTATIYGALGNFDVVNNTGQDACGFELELEGQTSAPVYTFSVNRYGAATYAPYTNGAASGWRVTWKSADCSSNKTVPHQPGTAFGGTCYQWNAVTYQTAGCEHFGAVANATKVTSRWLVKDPANPGSYIPHDPPMAVPMVYYYVAPAQIEVNWDVIQAEPASNSNGKRIACGSKCTSPYTAGTQVTLTATPPGGLTFANWLGACTGTAPTCTLSLQSDASVKAQFNK